MVIWLDSLLILPDIRLLLLRLEVLWSLVVWVNKRLLLREVLSLRFLALGLKISWSWVVWIDKWLLLREVGSSLHRFRLIIRHLPIPTLGNLRLRVVIIACGGMRLIDGHILMSLVNHPLDVLGNLALLPLNNRLYLRHRNLLNDWFHLLWLDDHWFLGRMVLLVDLLYHLFVVVPSLKLLRVLFDLVNLIVHLILELIHDLTSLILCLFDHILGYVNTFIDILSDLIGGLKPSNGSIDSDSRARGCYVGDGTDNWSSELSCFSGAL